MPDRIKPSSGYSDAQQPMLYSCAKPL